ncbi:MAG: glycosyltransferase family 4 protein, partial [Pseudomonadota bacterium]|nr:glycosyltransferase family 4 protein [Pseudomonadota bacterium]
MKILMISYNEVGRGTFIRAYELARKLVKLGQEISILASSKNRTKAIVQWPDVGGVQIIASPLILGGPFHSGFDPFEVQIRNSWVKGQSFDIVHGFESRPVVIYPALQLKNRGTPLILDWCDWYGTGGSIEERLSPIKRSILRPIEDFYENHFRLTADATTVICSLLKERAISQGVNKESITLLPNGLDIDESTTSSKSAARSYFGIEESDFVIGYVGSLFPNDANLLREAFRVISKKLPNAHLLHLGLSNYIVNETEFTTSKITLTGEVSDNEIQLGLYACDL